MMKTETLPARALRTFMKGGAVICASRGDPMAVFAASALAVPPCDVALDTEQVEFLAALAHETNRLWCELHGDKSQVHWEDAPEAIRASAVAGIRGALAGNTPEEQHASWSAYKTAQGYVRGPVKDDTAKTHPQLVPYADLPPVQRRKDHLYGMVVRAAAMALTIPDGEL